MFLRKGELSIKKKISLILIVALLSLSCACYKNEGKFYSIDEAYESGWITQNDIKEICYNKFGEVWIGENEDYKTWVRIEYTPVGIPSHIDKKTESIIKKSYYELNKSKFFEKDGKRIGGINDIIVECYGIYKDTYILCISCPFINTADVVTSRIVAGVAWRDSGESFCAFRKN